MDFFQRPPEVSEKQLITVAIGEHSLKVVLIFGETSAKNIKIIPAVY